MRTTWEGSTSVELGEEDMRLRNLWAATALSALAIGAVGVPAHSASPPSPANAGTVVTWGDEADVTGAAAIPIPADLTGPVRSVATNAKATGVVTLDGAVRVWGDPNANEVGLAPTGVTDATVITFTSGNAAILHDDGHITAWGNTTSLSDEIPADLRAKAIALQINVGLAVRTDGTLASWGDAPVYPLPTPGLTDLVDVAASLTHALALHADGTVTSWGAELPGLQDVPDFGGKKVVKIAVGFGTSGAVFADGTMEIWGFSGLIPPGQPTFTGLTPAGKVVDLSLEDGVAAAVTADGAVHAWGNPGYEDTVDDIPASLDGEPVSAIAVTNRHAAVITTTYRTLSEASISGTPEVGQTLTATPATFSLTPTTTAGQWYAGGAPIAGKTGTTLSLDASLVGTSISYRTTATRGAETIVSTSAPVGPVSPATSTTTLSVGPASAVVGSTRTVTATVAAAGAPTGTVTFTDGATTSTVALSGAKATWTLPALTVGSHSITAAYSGDSGTKPSTSTASTVTVAKAGSKVSGKAKAKGKTETVAKKVTITVTVRPDASVSPAGKITVKLKGKTKAKVTVTVDAQGRARVTVKNVKRGTYTVSLSYAGNSDVLAGSGKMSFKV
jgi:Big-like domain-containing protein